VGTLCLAGVPGNLAAYRGAVQDRLRGLARYWTGSAYASAVMPGGGDIYYDDNAWVGLALVLQYRLGLSDTLDRARQLFGFAQTGWDRRGSDPAPGGVFWVQQGWGLGLTNHDRGAGATAGSAELGFHVQELTGSGAPGATDMVDWVTSSLGGSGSGSGPFLNVVRRDGSIDTNVWSYNQGVMIGARVLQYRLTGSVLYLDAAVGIARQTLHTFGDFRNHPPSFNAMCFQNLLGLCGASGDTALSAEVLTAMRGYADWVWDLASGARDGLTGLFCFDDGGRPALGSQEARLQDQGAMTQLYALLAWAASDYGKLT
jgi:hypothetical protein